MVQQDDDVCTGKSSQWSQKHGFAVTQLEAQRERGFRAMFPFRSTFILTAITICFPFVLPIVGLYTQQANSGGGGGHASHHSRSTNHSHNHNHNSVMAADFSKKDEFRKYLEGSGVLDALTKALVGLYEEPEKPQSAMDYIKKYIGAPADVDVDGLKRENAQLKQEVQKLTSQLKNNQNSKGGGHHHHHHHNGHNHHHGKGNNRGGNNNNNK